MADTFCIPQTCTSLFEVTSQRQIWIEHLQRLVARYGTLPSTFDIPSMSLTDLKRAATRPYRFETTLLKKRLVNRIPEHMKPITGTQNLNFFDAKIVPGGQWLVTAGRTRWGGYAARDGPYDEFKPETIVSVWDIRPPAVKSIRQVAEFNVMTNQKENETIPKQTLPLQIHAIGVRLDEKNGRESVLITVRSTDGNNG